MHHLILWLKTLNKINQINFTILTRITILIN